MIKWDNLKNYPYCVLCGEVPAWIVMHSSVEANTNSLFIQAPERQHVELVLKFWSVINQNCLEARLVSTSVHGSSQFLLKLQSKRK